MKESARQSERLEWKSGTIVDCFPKSGLCGGANIFCLENILEAANLVERHFIFKKPTLQKE
ncbi:hypothetical protein [Chromobacterium subtsugae]|uniref:hypothetical protein n=1 Tax=Chromobacterium subtsugae TaxID=251747 RepID=UPI000AF64988|nr:hypothetical protein [Chromobacterium subtsugae]